MSHSKDKKSENHAALQLPVTAPLLGSYGTVSGLSKRSLDTGSKSAVMTVELGGKRVLVTDVKNADEVVLRFGESADRDTARLRRSRTLVIITASLLLLTMLTLLIWTLEFRGGFGFETPTILFNFHPFLQTGGFIFFSGYAMLFYRGLISLERSTIKILHTVFHTLALIFIFLGSVAMRQSVGVQFPDRPHYVTLHAWLGLITFALMGTQYITAFLAFIVGYYGYNKETAALRAKLVPLHSPLGILTFAMAAATSVSGLTEKAIFSISDMYILFTVEEAPYVNAVGLSLVAATVAMAFTLKDDRRMLSNQSQVYFIENID